MQFKFRSSPTLRVATSVPCQLLPKSILRVPTLHIAGSFVERRYLYPLEFLKLLGCPPVSILADWHVLLTGPLLIATTGPLLLQHLSHASQLGAYYLSVKSNRGVDSLSR